MSDEERLEQLQAALVARGVKDVKFFFGSVSEKPLSQLTSDAADVLQAIVDKNYTQLEPVDDSVRPKAAAT